MFYRPILVGFYLSTFCGWKTCGCKIPTSYFCRVTKTRNGKPLCLLPFVWRPKEKLKEPDVLQYIFSYIYMVCSLVLKFQWTFFLKSLLLCCYFDACRAFNWHCRRTHAPLVHLKSFILCPFLFGMFQSTSEKSILNQYVLLFLLFHIVQD
jgi:hypothetical protein